MLQCKPLLRTSSASHAGSDSGAWATIGGGEGDMLRFILGTLCGAALAVGYVRYEIQLPSWLHLPARLQGNLVSTATESELFDLSRDEDTRRRALEVYFTHRAAAAAAHDKEAGHPFLGSLYRERAAREAQHLDAAGLALEKALRQPALRTALEQKYGTADDEALRRAAHFDALDRYPFLKSWLAAERVTVTPATLTDVLAEVIRGNVGNCPGRR